MGLSRTVSKAVKQALIQVGDLRSDVVYYRVTEGAYDPSTDEKADTTTTVEIKGVLVPLTDDEQSDYDPDKITQKLLVAGDDLSFTPSKTDYVTISGDRWEIMKVRGVPGGSLWKLFIQEP